MTLGEEILRDKVARAADPVEYLIQLVLKERREAAQSPCSTCDGAGEIIVNNTINRDPQADRPERCGDCGGAGWQ